MADSPKVRVGAYATENKLNSDVIIAYLKKQKIEVKSINSLLTPEAIEVLNAHFKKEIDKEKNRTNKYDKLKEKIEADKVKESPPKEKFEKKKGTGKKSEQDSLFTESVPVLDAPPAQNSEIENQILTTDQATGDIQPGEPEQIQAQPLTLEASATAEVPAQTDPSAPVATVSTPEVEPTVNAPTVNTPTVNTPIVNTPIVNTPAEPAAVPKPEKVPENVVPVVPATTVPSVAPVVKTPPPVQAKTPAPETRQQQPPQQRNQQYGDKKPQHQGQKQYPPRDQRNKEVSMPFGGTASDKQGTKPPPRAEGDQRPQRNDRRDRPFDKKPAAFVPPNERVQQGRGGGGLTILGTFPEKKAAPAGQAKQQTPGQVSFSPEPDDRETKKKVENKKKVKTKAKPDDKNAKATPVKKLKAPKFVITADEIDDAVSKTIADMNRAPIVSSSRQKLKKRKKQERQERVEEQIIQQELDSKKIQVTEFIAVNEISTLMNVSVASVIEKFFRMGKTVTINQRLDLESIEIIADEFGFEIELVKEYSSDALEDFADKEEDLKDRAPIVTIMGHVDHGKTSLLDYIRRTNVVAGEAGGITQHIGAYRVDVGNGRTIAFLDTPGHEAFTSMRARGAQVTDIVILVVAADDAVMPTTIEAINHAKAANVPIIVAVNKIDKPGVNIDRIRQQLADRDILVEDWGGKYQCVQLSAKTGLNVDLLLEKILIEADLLQLRANPDRNARGVIIEAELDKGKGVTTTVLVQKGTLRVGDPFIAGNYFGRVRAMFDERKRKVEFAGPATPVQILGLEGTPQAGDVFVHIPNEREAREIALKRQQIKREQDHKQVHHITLDEISKQISIGGVKELTVIVKGDVDGSVEAIADSLMKLSNQEVIVKVIHRGVGAISESDVLLAAASNAIIVGFHVRPNTNARKLAETQKVDIRLYNIIYNAISEVKSALEGLLSPIISEEITGTVEVRATFKVPKIGMIAGCYVQEGRINRSNRIRVVRDGVVVYEGELSSLKHVKDDVREALAGHECGIGIHNFNDVKVGDIIEAFKVIETKKKL